MSPMAADYSFFFSSRRRHTRLQGDWSSDVCSSDLAVALARGSPAFPPTVAEALLLGSGILRRPFLPFLHARGNAVVAKTVVVQTHLTEGLTGPSSGERKRTSVSLSRMTEYRPRCGRGRARRMPANPFVPSDRVPHSQGVR